MHRGMGGCFFCSASGIGGIKVDIVVWGLTPGCQLGPRFSIGMLSRRVETTAIYQEVVTLHSTSMTMCMFVECERSIGMTQVQRRRSKS